MCLTPPVILAITPLRDATERVRAHNALASAEPGFTLRSQNRGFLPMNEKPEPMASRWHIPPLVARELIAYSRRPWTYWLRLLTALGAVSVLVIIAATGQARLGRTDGLSLFAGSTVVLFLVASLNGLRSTCDCISGERRQGTLVLLFLASLKLNTILVSKLVTHSLRNAWAFLGTLPVLALCVLLGGVSGLMFAKGALAILAAAWLSLMVGLEQSCRNQGEHEAFSHGLRKLLLLNLLPFLSPASLLLSMFVWRWKVYYWLTLGGTLLAGWTLWSAAKTALANNWQAAPSDEGPPSSGRPPPPAPPATGHLKRPPRRCGNTPPAYWLFARYGDARQASPLAIGISFVVVVGLISFLTLLSADSDTVVPLYATMMGAARFAQMLAMAKIAPQSFAEITRQGALEILQTTPITLKEIVRAAYDFLKVHFRRGVVPMLGLDLLVLLTLAFKTHNEDGSVRRLAGLILAQNSIFLSGLCAMGVTGVWLGLKQRSLTRASLSLVFYFLLLPASLYLFWSSKPMFVTLLLVSAYSAIAVLMARILNRVTQGGDGLQRLLRPGE